MPSITNLTPLQQAIAEMLWSLDTTEEIVEWFATLPQHIVPIAHSIMNMMVYAQIDETPIEDLSAAEAVIEHVRSM